MQQPGLFGQNCISVSPLISENKMKQWGPLPHLLFANQGARANAVFAKKKMSISAKLIPPKAQKENEAVPPPASFSFALKLALEGTALCMFRQLLHFVWVVNLGSKKMKQWTPLLHFPWEDS